MKKLLYTLLFISTIAISFTACSEEEIKPSTELDNGLANVDGDKGKN